MSFKTFLQKLTGESKLENLYQEEILEFSEIILGTWKTNCTNRSKEGKSSAALYSFSLDKCFKDVRISYMVENGLLDILTRKTDMDIFYAEYIVDSRGHIVKKISGSFDTDVSHIDEENKSIAMVGVIYTKW